MKFANLVRNVASGKHFVRFRNNGKRIRPLRTPFHKYNHVCSERGIFDPDEARETRLLEFVRTGFVQLAKNRNIKQNERKSSMAKKLTKSKTAGVEQTFAFKAPAAS